MPSCAVCGGSSFSGSQGFFYCTECGTQAADRVEEIDDERIGAAWGRSVRKRAAPYVTRKRDEGIEKRPWDLYEAMQLILKAQVHALIAAGFPKELKGTVGQLWFLLLKARGVAFTGCPDAEQKLLDSHKEDGRDALIKYRKQRAAFRRKRAEQTESVSSTSEEELDEPEKKRPRPSSKRKTKARKKVVKRKELSDVESDDDDDAWMSSLSGPQDKDCVNNNTRKKLSKTGKQLQTVNDSDTDLTGMADGGVKTNESHQGQSAADKVDLSESSGIDDYNGRQAERVKVCFENSLDSRSSDSGDGVPFSEHHRYVDSNIDTDHALYETTSSEDTDYDAEYDKVFSDHPGIIKGISFLTPFVMNWKRPHIVQLVALCYIGLICHRQPVYVADMCKWLRQGWFPYVSAVKVLKPHMRMGFRQRFFFTPPRVPHPHLIFTLVHKLVHTLSLTYLPPTPMADLTNRLINQLKFPAVIQVCVRRLMQIIRPDCSAALCQFDSQRDAVPVSPDLATAALVVIVVKLFYGLDGEQERLLAMASQLIDSGKVYSEEQEDYLITWQDWVRLISEHHAKMSPSACSRRQAQMLKDCRLYAKHCQSHSLARVHLQASHKVKMVRQEIHTHYAHLFTKAVASDQRFTPSVPKLNGGLVVENSRDDDSQPSGNVGSMVHAFPLRVDGAMYSQAQALDSNGLFKNRSSASQERDGESDGVSETSGRNMASANDRSGPRLLAGAHYLHYQDAISSHLALHRPYSFLLSACAAEVDVDTYRLHCQVNLFEKELVEELDKSKPDSSGAGKKNPN